MTEYELLRIISFLERMRTPYDKLLSTAEPDPNWNIILHLMKNHLRGENVTMSGLASTAEIPFASAMRRIHKLIESGDIQLRKRSGTGKSHYLEPSRKLAIAFTDYAVKVKGLLADTFGLRSGSADSEDYYFGGSYFAGQIIPPLEIMEKKHDSGNDLRFLLHDDNYFSSMRNMWSDFRSKLSARKNFTLLALPELREEVFANARREESHYDVIAINMPWIGESVVNGVAQPLTKFLKSGSINPLDFHPNIWATGRWNNTQYGIPIYCTIEALSVRKDLFEDRGLTHPTSFEKVIESGKSLHNPKRGIYGTVWNAAKGMPISNERKIGYNTDSWGFAESFRDNMRDAPLRRVVQFGAGGAGAAVAHALMDLGAGNLVIVDLIASRAKALADRMFGRYSRRIASTADGTSVIRMADGIVNATPVGMIKYPGVPFEPELLLPRHWVAEIIYFPEQTELLCRSRELGCRTLSGAGMAVYQAVRAFELFTGRAPDRRAMAEHFRAAA